MSSLYCAYFRLEETPFSISPDPRFVYLSERHKEALGHLLYGLGEGGGFVQLTGEVGTGKTTICRTLLCQLPDNVDVGLIFNPKLSVPELLQSICEELRVELPDDITSTKVFVDRLYHHLLDAHAAGRRTILIIDEAQNLSSEVLEQIRLLTNLETDDHKLLQVFLIGQPELRTVLARNDLRQLAQRITARYHLEPLNRAETSEYIEHRLSVAGCRYKVFSDGARRKVFKLTGGVPRLINALCDRALLGAFSVGSERIDSKIIARANRELQGVSGEWPMVRTRFVAIAAALGCMSLLVMLAFYSGLLSLIPFAGAARSMTMSSVESGVAPPESDSKSTVMPESITAPEVRAANTTALPERLPESGGGELGSTSSLPASSALPSPRPELEAPATRTLHEIIDAAASDNGPAASQRLLALWGIGQPVSDEELCQRAIDEGLACLNSAGSWSKLRGFDLPALLSLRSTSGETIQALLVELAGQGATLYVGDQRRHFRLHEVDRHWTGDFVVLWKPPFEGVTIIGPSHPGKGRQWLRETFSRLDGIESDARGDPPIKGDLSARLRDFQRRRGLQADGIAGPETLIHLTSLGNDSKFPTLSPTRHAVHERTGHIVTRISQLEAE
jgi:general secretion pathway protein A